MTVLPDKLFCQFNFHVNEILYGTGGKVGIEEAVDSHTVETAVHNKVFYGHIFSYMV